MSSRDHFLSQSCLRTRRPEPIANPEAKPARRCERCGCKLASDTGPYRGHLLCSPCLKPIVTVIDGIPVEHLRRIVGLCSGYTVRETAGILGLGESTPGTTLLNVARLAEISTSTLRNAVTWALAHGLVARDSAFPPKDCHEESPARDPQPHARHALPITPLQEAEREYQAAVDALAEMVAPMVVPLFLRAIRAAYQYGQIEGR